jgi:MFS superfamily sulfate permease-like transporter
LSIASSAFLSRKSAAALSKEGLAGITVACANLPICIAGGVVAYGPLGGSYVVQGAIAGLYAAVFIGFIAALIASSSFVITGPAPAASIVLMAIVADLLQKPGFAGHPDWIVGSVGACVLAAGIVQILFGAMNVGRVIKFTPYAVIAGFINSVGMLIAASQLKPFFHIDPTDKIFSINQPSVLAFVAVVFALVLWLSASTKKVPAPLGALVIGTGLFYAARVVPWHLQLGPTLGSLAISFPPVSPVATLFHAPASDAFFSAAPELLLDSVTLAIIVTLLSLLTFRAAQNLADFPTNPRRDLIAQGVANCIGGPTTGIVGFPLPVLSPIALRAGGRTRFTGLSAAAVLFCIMLFLKPMLESIPVAVLSGILVAIAFQILDRWSIRLLAQAIRNPIGLDRAHVWQNIAVVAIVMVVTATSSIVAGAIAGIGLSCLIFVVRMSRPLIRRSFSGAELFSKRVRSAEDMEILRRTGARRIVLELEGVLFFGNADDLEKTVLDVLRHHDMFLFDLRRVNEIDVSGATILANVIVRCRAAGTLVAFSSAPIHRANVATATKGADALLPDLDAGLEYLEEATLRAAARKSHRTEAIPLPELEMLKDLDSSELSTLTRVLVRREFADDEVICVEGDDADRMWIIAKGSVSVRLQSSGHVRRLAGLGVGMVVGEMGLLDGGRRSATLACDELVIAYELSRTAFELISREHPHITQKLLTYFARELIRRMRLLNAEVRTLLERG